MEEIFRIKEYAQMKHNLEKEKILRYDKREKQKINSAYLSR